MALSLDAELKKLLGEYRAALARAEGEQQIRKANADYVGAIRQAQKNALKSAPAAEKKQIGQLTNEIVREAEQLFERALAGLAEEARRRDLSRSVDVTLPARGRRLGHLHPITLARREIEEIFAQLGFVVAEGPQVETDFHNFEALAIPKDHPARDMQDTFYVDGGMLLRTHTSNGQIRVMEKRRPPLAVVCPGRCYRRDDLSVRASPMFTQIEGFMVDKRGRITMAHLKGVLTEFVRAFFGTTAVRFRSSYFPFTEPSAELDMHCLLCDGAGCPVCKHSGWTEVLGCGMIHPSVMRAVEYNPDEYQGFAFGMGVERTGLLKLGVDDMRLFFENDLRFLGQFPALSGGVR